MGVCRIRPNRQRLIFLSPRAGARRYTSRIGPVYTQRAREIPIRAPRATVTEDHRPIYGDHMSLHPDIAAVLSGESEGCIIHGDCLEIMADMPDGCAVVSDPPWGSNTSCNAQRFTRANSPWWGNVDTSKITPHEAIHGDDGPFDPTPFIVKQSILWGANWYAHRLPPSGGWFIWDKRKGAEDMADKGWPLGEAELAWTNILGSTRVFRNLWSGLLRSEEKGEFYHPTQKPVALMMWCIEKLKGNPVILDPYAGSGTTCVAAKKLGKKYIGIEIKERYCEIARNRVRDTPRPLFTETVETKPDRKLFDKTPCPEASDALQ